LKQGSVGLSSASNLQQIANALCAQVNSASYPQRMTNEHQLKVRATG